MNQPWLSPEMFAVACLGVGGSLLAFTGLVIERRRPGRGGWVYLGAALALVFFSACLAAWEQPRAGWASLLILAGACGGLWLVSWPRLPVIGADLARLILRPATVCLLLLVGGPALALWHVEPALRTTVAPRPSQVVALDPVARAYLPGVAFTDEYREVELFTAPAGEAILPEAMIEEAEAIDSQGLTYGVIRVAPPDETYNCHGWVFTGGRCWVRSEQVESILRDNRYRVVSQPLSGDVAVYRDDEGAIIHTGIVRAVGEHDFILLESKWGRLGRYIHQPEISSYNTECVFYRSRREGHILNGLPTGSNPSAQTNENEQTSDSGVIL